VTASGESLLLSDNASLNGVFVNGRQVEQHLLQHQDHVNLGVYELRDEASAEPLAMETIAGRASELAALLAEETPAPAERHVRTRSRSAAFEDSVATGPEALLDRLQQVESENELLKLLLRVGKVLSSALAPADVMQRVMELVFEMQNVDRGFVMLRDEKGFKPAVLLYRGQHPGVDAAAPSSLVLSRQVMERITVERLPLLIRNVAEDPRFVDSESLRVSGVRSAMCAPLIFKDNLFGIFYVDCLSKPLAFDQEQLSIFSVIAAQAAISFENARSHEELSQRALERQALTRFLSPPVVDKILADPSQVQLGGESQVVTVLFADIRGFSRMSAKLEPAAVVELLNEFFSQTTDLIFENGGTLDKYIGDRLLAVFGAPTPQPDHAFRAARTAAAMRGAIERLNRDWQSGSAEPLPMGIGLNTGTVTAGNIGSPQRMDYTVIGDAVKPGVPALRSRGWWPDSRFGVDFQGSEWRLRIAQAGADHGEGVGSGGKRL
jgi:adenylate cyclase